MSTMIFPFVRRYWLQCREPTARLQVSVHGFFARSVLCWGGGRDLEDGSQTSEQTAVQCCGQSGDGEIEWRSSLEARWRRGYHLMRRLP